MKQSAKVVFHHFRWDFNLSLSAVTKRLSAVTIKTRHRSDNKLDSVLVTHRLACCCLVYRRAGCTLTFLMKSATLIRWREESELSQTIRPLKGPQFAVHASLQTLLGNGEEDPSLQGPNSTGKAKTHTHAASQDYKD